MRVTDFGPLRVVYTPDAIPGPVPFYWRWPTWELNTKHWSIRWAVHGWWNWRILEKWS